MFEFFRFFWDSSNEWRSATIDSIRLCLAGFLVGRIINFSKSRTLIICKEAVLAKFFKDAPSSLKLWSHQRDAVKFAVDKLNEGSTPCLIRMPTGTGKTGVIAVLAAHANPGRTLILTPWVHLRAQIIQELKSRFWERIKAPIPTVAISELLPNNINDALADSDILVASFASLTDIRRNNPEAYDRLKLGIKLVLVDEGHYEPAVEWGQSVKKLYLPTILLTATPYRNDFKLFRIAQPENATFEYSHSQAESEDVLRKLRFVSLGSASGVEDMAGKFSEYWKLSRKNGEFPASAARAIICCEKAADIKVVVNVLLRRGIKALGIHDSFVGKEAGFFKMVPVSEVDSEVWVHQKKLAEGIDDSRFSCVALFCRFSNDRRLIQQIGRVLRKAGNDLPGKDAVVVAPDDLLCESRWHAYREYEKTFKVHGVNHFRDFVSTMLAAQPEFEYFEGRFRKRFDENLLGRDTQVTIAPSVLVRLTNPEFELDDYIDNCTDALNLSDAIILGSDINAPCQLSKEHAIWVYASLSNSRLLDTSSLYEVRLQAHCVAHFNGFLLISDTSGVYPEEFLERFTTLPGVKRLSGLFEKTDRMTNVSLQNTIPFDSVVRAADIRGTDLSRISASLTDRIQICRSARGLSKGQRRYVGFQRARVRQELTSAQRQGHQVEEFLEWAKNISAILNQTHGSRSHTVLTRYLQPANPPNNIKPKTISLDLQQPHIRLVTTDGYYVETKTFSTKLVLNVSSGTNPVYICDFSFNTHDKKSKMRVSLRLEFQVAKNRFWFKSSGSQVLRVEVEGQTTQIYSLPEYLNRRQEYVLISMADGESIYQGRNFYAVNYAHAERAVLARIKNLDAVAVYSEKGTKAELDVKNKNAINDFLPGTMFDFISNNPAAFEFDVQVLVCADLGTECADFVAVNFDEKRLAFVHAKIGKGSKISASDFHDVVSQAMKNLVYFSPGSAVPEGVASWKSTERWNNCNIGRVRKNSVKTPEGEALWDRIKEEILGSANADLQVILATAGCCDRSVLEAAINKPSKRTAETGQLMHLLNGLNGTARALGAQVKVLNLPFLVRKRNVSPTQKN